MCDLTVDEITLLKEFNQLLSNIQTMLVIQLERLQTNLSRRFSGFHVEISEFKLDAEITYYLRDDDPEFNPLLDNIIAVRRSNFSADVLNEIDWGVTFENQFGFNQHCWLFHELYVHGENGNPPLSRLDILRIGNLSIYIKPSHPIFLDLPDGDFELRYVHPIRQFMHSPYMPTYSGKHILTFPYTPKRDDIDIEDIIQGLSNQCKYFGQTKSFYSFAQHCLLVASLVPDKLRPAALIYPAYSAYIGESQNRFQLPEMNRYITRLQAAIAHRFGVSKDTFEDAQFLRARRCVQLTEKRDVIPELRVSFFDLSKELKVIKPMTKFIICLSPEEAKRQYRNALMRYLPNAFQKMNTVT